MPDTDFRSLKDLQDDVLIKLNEASDSSKGQLDAGDNSGRVRETREQITVWLNEALNRLARRCYPLPGAGELEIAGGVYSVGLQFLTVEGGGRLFSMRGVSWNGNALEICARSYAEIRYPASTTGVPRFYYPDGPSTIGLVPTPAASGVVHVDGYKTPAPLVKDTDIPAWLEPDLHYLPSDYAAAKIALKNLEDESLAERAKIWNASFERGEAELLSVLVASSPQLVRAHFTLPGGK